MFYGILLTCDESVQSAVAQRGESDGRDKTEPQRLTDSVVHPEDANEISGGRTNARKHSFQERRPYTNSHERINKRNSAEWDSA